MIYFIFVFNLFVQAGESQVVRGDVYQAESGSKEFLFERHVEKKDDLSVDKSIYKDLSDNVLVEEIVKTKDKKLISYSVNQKQTEEKGRIEIKENSVFYSFEDENNNVDTVKRSLPKDFIVPPELWSFVKNNRKTLLSGESISFKMGVWRRKDHYSFYIKRINSTDGEIVLKMQLSNILFRVFTNPMYFTFDKKTEQLISYKGPLNLRDTTSDGSKDYMGVIKYRFKQELNDALN